MTYSRYLEAFYRGYSRRTVRGRDNVQFRYHGEYRITFWSYSAKVIAIVASQEYEGTRYLLLRQPQTKSKKAILTRLGSILARYSILEETLHWENGSLLLYMPGHSGPQQTNESITERLKQIIWND